MTIKHTITSELTPDPEHYTQLNDWAALKTGDTARADEIFSTTNDGSNVTEVFSIFYDAWMVDQKIVHLIEKEGQEAQTISYKDITPERLAFVNANLHF